MHFIILKDHIRIIKMQNDIVKEKMKKNKNLKRDVRNIIFENIIIIMREGRLPPPTSAQSV